MTFPIPDGLRAGLAAGGATLRWLVTFSMVDEAASAFHATTGPYGLTIGGTTYEPRLLSVTPWNIITCNFGSVPLAQCTIRDDDGSLFDVWSAFAPQSTTASFAIGVLRATQWTTPFPLVTGVIAAIEHPPALERRQTRIIVRPKLFARTGGRLKIEKGAAPSGALDAGDLQTFSEWANG